MRRVSLRLVMASFTVFTVSLLSHARRNYPIWPTPSADWASKTETLVEKKYDIQKGDNLWTLSKIFFGDEKYWSKMWAINRDLWFNPHKIEVGDWLIFDTGSLERPPSVKWFRANGLVFEFTQLSELEDWTRKHFLEKVSQAEVYSPIAKYMVKNRIKLESEPFPETYQLKPPKLEVIFPPPLLELPSSLPSSRYPELAWPPDLFEMAQTQRVPPLEHHLDCFVSDRSVFWAAKRGKVVDIDDNMLFGHEGVRVLVSGDSLQVGKSYAVLSEHPKRLPSSGFLVRWSGRVVIERNLKRELFEGRIHWVGSPVPKGAEIFDWPEEKVQLFEFRQDQVLAPFGGKVFTGYCDEEPRKILGTQDVILVLTDPPVTVEQGKYFYLYPSVAARESRISDRNLDWKPQIHPHGLAYVLKSSGPWITALVIDSRFEITSEDTTSP